MALGLAATAGFAQTAPNRYALILEDPPVASRYSSKEAVRSAAASNYRAQVEAKQKAVRAELAARKIRVTGSVSTLANAIFVIAPPSRLAELKSLPGVKGVVPMRRYHMKLNRATQLLNAPAAWSAIGGAQNAGAGIKIAILDSGIDQTQPAFQDKSLAIPSGYPICAGSDCGFTNNKVIVARSYVRLLAVGTDPNNPAADSRPDDYSPRDRDGHGTAVASCAAGETNTGAVTFSGMAPKAYLGNYKIYGSPEVNDSTMDDVIIQALDDAVKDGMDIASFSSGGPAFSGPLDSGAACGNNPGVPCDLVAQTFENAAKAGMIIVSAAGNDGQSSQNYPAYGSMESPADAPSVIAAGASTNSHFFLETVSVPGGPSNLQNLATQSGDAYVPTGAISAPLVDVTQVGDNGLACSALPAWSLTGAIALIERGTCNFSDKMGFAQDAGAVGVIFYMADQTPAIAPGGLSNFYIPGVMVSNSDGLALKTFAESNPYHAVTIDPNAVEQDSSSFNQLAGFSSVGPSTGDNLLKPDVLAVGTSVYMAGQTYDPLGALYSSNGYVVADGTSFATPLTSGTAALVKQAHPAFTAAQVRSALINTASQDVTTDNQNNPVDMRQTGAGKIDAGAAVGATVTVAPPTVSFGALKTGALPASSQIQFTNGGTAPVTLTLALAQNVTGVTGATVTLDKQSLSLAPNATGTANLALSGTVPQPGYYSGAITVQGSGVSLRVPYQYLVSDGVAADILPLTGTGFDGTVNQGIPDGIISFRLVDQFGVGVAGAPVTWTARNGGTLQNSDSATDAYGIAAAQPVLGSQPGNYSFTASAGGQSTTFSGTARLQPNIPSDGVANGASFARGKPVVPGSYITIFGTALSDTTNIATSKRLPLAIDLVNVSFDVPSAKLSVPGHLLYVSPTQVNVQVPWELQGQSSAQMKVTIDYSNGNVVTVPLAQYDPALYESGQGAVAAVDANGQPISGSNPARRGQTIQLYANGLGPVTNQPASGDPASASPLSKTTTDPVVTIGGQTAAVSYSGLAPGYAGLYQVSITVPASLGAGNQSITIAIGGQTSPASSIAVQ